GKVQKSVGAALAFLLDAPCAGYQGGDRCAAFARYWRGAEGRGLASDGQVQIDAIEQRSREFAAIALDLIRRAAAATAGIAKVAARAGVHRRNQLKACWEAHPITGAGDHDMTAFQGLTQDLEHLAAELGQLVQKQHAMVSQGDFARLWAAASAH